MIVVFGGWPTRSQRVMWLLEEMGLPYELRPVDIRNRAADTEFLDVNPAGFLPVLREGDVAMVESIAIMEHLIARHGPTDLAPAAGDPDHGPYQQFLHLGEAGMAAYLNIVVASRFFAPQGEKENWGARTAVGMFFSRLGLVTRRLQASAYLAGERFTAADISVTYALEMGGRLGLAERYDPVITAYLEQLRGRDGYQKALARSPPS